MEHSEQVREVAAWAPPAGQANWDKDSSGVTGRASVSINVCWGDEVMLSRELDEKTGFTLGTSAELNADFALAEEHLGAASWQLVRRAGTTPVLRIPAHAAGFVEFPGEAGVALDTLRSKLGPIDSGHELALPLGARAVIQLGSVAFDLHHTRAEAPWARALGTDIKPFAAYFGASFVSAAALIAGMAFFVPPLGLNDGERVDTDRIYLLQQYLDAAAEREETDRQDPAASVDDQAGGRDGAKAAGDEGALGKPEAVKTKGKIAVKGPAENPTPELSPREQAVTFGMIGLLAGGVDSESPTSPWQRDPTIGSDPLDAAGAMWGDELADVVGGGGLGLMGLGEGGGGQHRGIGLTGIGTIGSAGNCTGSNCFGMGPGTGHSFDRTGTGHKPKGVIMRVSEPSVSGRLPPQTIQRIVRQNFGRFRMCYEKGLGRNPNLEGRVQVRFLIDRNGTVSNALNAGSAIPDSDVVGCVVRSFYGLSFPKPDNGSVQVSYPIVFSPG